MHNVYLRPAVAMIELIFALVIMGLALLTAPLILNMSMQSSDTAMQQESIAVTSDQVSLILTHHWDEGDSNATTGFGILGVSHGDSELDSANRRSFDTNATIYSRRFNTITTTASLPSTFGNIGDSIPNNDIDDFHAETRTVALRVSSETSVISDNEGEYIKGDKLKLTSTITYGNDNASYGSTSVAFNSPFTPAASGSTNIKLISVVLEDETDPSNSISLYAFACNIGNARIIPTPMD